MGLNAMTDKGVESVQRRSTDSSANNLREESQLTENNGSGVKDAVRAHESGKQNDTANQALPSVELFGDETFKSKDLKPIYDENKSEWDKNGDGNLDETEMSKALKTASGKEAAALNDMSGEFFSGFDKNGDNEISPDEMQKYDVAQKQFQKHLDKASATAKSIGENFDDMDLNNDDKITKDEIVAASSNDAFSESDRSAYKELADNERLEEILGLLENDREGITRDGNSLQEFAIWVAAVEHRKSGGDPLPAGIEYVNLGIPRDTTSSDTPTDDAQPFSAADVKPSFEKNLSNWDKNGDDALSKDEIDQAMDVAYNQDLMLVDVLGEKFDRFDNDSDGNIDQTEIDYFDESAHQQSLRAEVDEYFRF